jgi:alcohol dehydrogenase (cytochrome c)
VAWSHRWTGSTQVRSGVLSTAGNVVFAGDSSVNFVAFDAAKGVPLWRAGLHTSITNGPMTYELDGAQHVVVGAGDSLYAFALRR